MFSGGALATMGDPPVGVSVVVANASWIGPRAKTSMPSGAAGGSWASGCSGWANAVVEIAKPTMAANQVRMRESMMTSLEGGKMATSGERSVGRNLRQARSHLAKTA